MIISKIILFYFLFGRQSVFPPILSMEPCRPVRHHIVVYLLAQTKEDHSTLNGRLRLHQEEVDAATWLDEETATQAAASDDFGQSLKVPQRYFRSVNRRPFIDNFPIAHNTLCLPPKFCITYCLKMLLGKCNTPRSI